MPKYQKNKTKYIDKICSDVPHNLFYIPLEKIQKKEILIDGEKFHYIKNVLRKNAKDIIFLTDGNGYRYKAEILYITKSEIKAKILEKNFIKRKNLIDIELAFVPLKGGRNDFIIEKGTELGIKRFIPFFSKFSIVTNLHQTKLNRFRKIAISAMLQSQQYYMPKIIFQKDLNTLAEKFKDFDLVLLSDKNGDSFVPLGAKSILYMVGPEGGFDEAETELFKNSGAILLSLGQNRLRSETAAICGLAKILTAYGNI